MEGGWGSRVVGPFSLVVVAAFQVFTLNVPSAVVRSRKLNSILVHTPADASFATARWLALRDKKQEHCLDEKGKKVLVRLQSSTAKFISLSSQNRLPVWCHVSNLVAEMLYLS